MHTAKWFTSVSACCTQLLRGHLLRRLSDIVLRPLPVASVGAPCLHGQCNWIHGSLLIAQSFLQAPAITEQHVCADSGVGRGAAQG